MTLAESAYGEKRHEQKDIILMKIKGPLSLSFVRLYMLAFFFFCANSILTVIIPLESNAQGVGKTEIGFTMGAYMLTCMLLRPWAGQAVAKYGALQTMRVLLIIHAAVLVLYAISSVEGYLPLRALQGVVTAFFSMAMQMGVVEALPEKDRAQGVTLYTLATMLPQLFGPMAALYMFEHTQFPIFGAGMVALGLLAWLCGLSVPLPSSASKGMPLSFADMLKSTTQLWTNRVLRVCSSVMLLASVVFGAIMIFLPLYLETEGKGNAGLYFMLQTAVIVGCRFVLRKKIPSDGRWNTSLIAGLLILAAVGTLFLAMLHLTSIFLYLSAISNGIAIALLYPTLVTYLTFVMPTGSRNLLIGLFISAYDLGSSLGGLLMGVLADRFSYSTVYNVCAILCIIALIIVICNRNQMTTMEQA